MNDLTNLEGMQAELASLERALANNTQRQERLSTGATGGVVSTLNQLADLEQRVDYLALEQDLYNWAAGCTSDSSSEGLSSDFQQCVSLGRVLCKHPAKLSQASSYGKLYTSLWQEEYQPLHHYVRSKMIVLLRNALRTTGYPSEKACQTLSEHCQRYRNNPKNVDEVMTASWCCDWLNRLQASHQRVVTHVNSDNDTSEITRSDVVLELCRPLLERLRFHFVETAPDRITSSRIDRLPEWLLNYVREHVFEGGPWELVIDGIAPVVEHSNAQGFVVEFQREVNSMAQSVLLERNFFRHALVAGPDSNPRVLCNGIEQLMIFDAYTRELLPVSSDGFSGLTECFVATDEELWQWWLDRERDWLLSTLFQTTLEEFPTTLLSPRAELFCALLQSIKSKARVLSSTFSSTYVGRVAVPGCMDFLDAIHTSSTDLKALLKQRDADLEKNTTCWMETINGTHLASLVLSSSDSPSEYEPDSDLARVGRSVERLRDALVDEFATTFVETVLMERARLASYLMRCSHLLSTVDSDPGDTRLSPDLHEVVTVLSQVAKTCCKHLVDVNEQSDPASAIGQGPEDMLRFAPQAILSRIGDLVAEKFLEVALDSHGMTPDIVLNGAIVFRRDVNLVANACGNKSRFRRLLDVTNFMAMPSEWLISLREALLGLVQYRETSTEGHAILLFQQFSSDNTLFEEAKSMVEAKGFHHLELDDALSILNRRKDAFQ